MRRSLRSLIAAAAAILAVASIGVSAAAKLTLDTSGQLPMVDSWGRCGSAATVTIAGTAVAVTGLDSGCAGSPITVHVHGNQGTTAVSGTVSGTTAAMTLPSDPGTVNGVVVTVDTWALNTTWSQQQSSLPTVSCARIAGSGDCTATVTGITSWGWPTLDNYLLNVQVSSTSKSPVKWQVTINLSSSDLPFLATDLADNQGGLVKVSSSGCSASPRTVTVKGTTGWGNYDQVSTSNTVNMQVQGTLSGSGGLINC